MKDLVDIKIILTATMSFAWKSRRWFSSDKQLSKLYYGSCSCLILHETIVLHSKLPFPGSFVSMFPLEVQAAAKVDAVAVLVGAQAA